MTQIDGTKPVGHDGDLGFGPMCVGKRSVRWFSLLAAHETHLRSSNSNAWTPP